MEDEIRSRLDTYPSGLSKRSMNDAAIGGPWTDRTPVKQSGTQPEPPLKRCCKAALYEWPVGRFCGSFNT